jgi:amino acid adenylation domain-containing protein/non-ribosomal peptide synthase protein (TIGR01720 family)
MIDKQDIEDIYSLSPMQESMLIQYAIDRTTTAYVEQFDFTLRGELDVDRVDGSLNALIAKYAVLRTVFSFGNTETPWQIVLKRRTASAHRADLRDMDPDARVAYVERFKRDDREKGFDLSGGLLLRLSVLRTADDAYRLIFTFHHILMDGWCLGPVFEDFFAFYERLDPAADAPAAPREAHPYKRYIAWLTAQNRDEARDYWRALLEGYEKAVDLPRLESASGEVRLALHRFVIDRGLTGRLGEVARRLGVTLNVVVQTAWGVLLQKYNNTRDAVFGTVVSGRPPEIPGIETMVGLFINTVPLRVTAPEGATFADVAKAVQRQIAASRRHEYLPLFEIQSRSTLQSGLLNHIVAFENYPIGERMKGLGRDASRSLSVEHVNVFEQTTYDFNVIVNPGDELRVLFNYNANAIAPAIVAALEGCFVELIRWVVDDPERAVSEAAVLTEEQRGQILDRFNDTRTEYPRDATIQALFEEQAEMRPDHPAVVAGDRRLTYRELNARANRLAALLRAKGVRADRPVGLLVPRVPEMLVGILAVLKAGGAFVPVDPGNPLERNRFVAQDSGLGLLLTVSSLAADGGADAVFSGETILLDREATYQGDGANLPHENTADDLAYVMYTSGSTGRPKGCMVTHRNVIRLVRNSTFAPLGPSDRVLQTGAPVFDATTFENWASLLNGGTLHLVDEATILDPQRLARALAEYEITALWLTVGLFNQHADQAPEMFRGLTYLLVGGDVLSPKHVDRVRAACPGVAIINGYGPTENTTFSTTHRVDTTYASRIPIGRPIGNSTAYVVDDRLRLLPVGAVGELCVGGDGVARGYLNEPALTAERFVPDPFLPGRTMYRTGDMARWLPDGTLDFLGRTDFQVKVRGYRVELGEIERAIEEGPGVKEAIVVARDGDGGKHLCAYYVAGPTVAAEDLRLFLSGRLPSYMVPAAFIRMERFPLNVNGKVDRKALPEPGVGLASAGSEPPRNEGEESIARIWRDLLGVERVGIDDDFFKLGGHSLKALAMLNRLRKEIGIDLDIATFFEKPTIRLVSEHSRRKAYDALRAVEKREWYEVSAAQRRIFALTKLDPGGLSYNIPAAYEVEGDIDERRFAAALRQLVARHDGLRTGFAMVDGVPMQKVWDSVDVRLETVSCGAGESVRDALEAMIRPFDTELPPLMRVAFLRAEGRRYLFIDIHHSIADGVSMGILLLELRALYQGGALPPRETDYKEFAAWQNAYLASDRSRAAEDYWLRRLGGELPVLELPYDYPRPPVQSFEGGAFRFAIERETVAGLKRYAEGRGLTLYMVVLGALQILLAKLSGQEDVVVGSAVAGRTHPDAEGMVGMFVNTLPMRANPAGGRTLDGFMEDVKKGAVEAYEHADCPFDQLVEKLGVARDFGRNPVFDVMLGWENLDAVEMALEGATLREYPLTHRVAKFDLSLICFERDGYIVGLWEYATKLFEEETVRRFADMYERVLARIARGDVQTLGDIELTSPGERALVVGGFNATTTDYPRDASIVELFRRQVALTPKRTAVVCGTTRLTYEELDARADAIAGALAARGVGREDIVGVEADRSAQYVAAVLGVLKAGGAYAPIDPKLPPARKGFMADDCAMKAVLTLRAPAGEADRLAALRVPIDHVWAVPAPVARGGTGRAEDLAYVMYTSGSTGTPKGVMVTHRNVVRLVRNTSYVAFREDDRILLTGAVGFDATTFEIWGAFLNGLTLHLVDDRTLLNAALLARELADNGITILFLTPALFNELSRSDPTMFRGLRYLFVGGDVLSPTHIELVRKSCPGVSIVNAYGPTENATFSTTFPITEAFGQRIPIGKPIANSRAYIVDRELRAVPIGVPGELCVAGDGLAQGYLRRPELTAEKFVECPFEPGQKMYRTGDLARWRPDGTIDFLGRADQQVKIRGFRIELGEVENALLACPGVKDAVVVPKQRSAGTQLVGYFVADAARSCDDVRQALGASLPEYMVPAQLVRLEKLPVTPNGKVDRKALPDPEPERAAEAFGPATNDVEAALAAVWASVLGIERVGRGDNFFELGGDSIKAIQVVARLGEQGLELDVPTMFQFPTLNALGVHVKKKRSRADQGVVTGPVPLTPIQQWYLSGGLDPERYLNQGVCLFTTRRVVGRHVREAVAGLVRHHDALRLRYRTENGVVSQHIPGPEGEHFEYVYEDADGRSEDGVVRDVGQRLHRSMRPAEGGLVKVGHVRGHDGDYIIFVVHHLVEDAISIRILQEDFVKAYEQAESGKTVDLGLKTDSYKAWSEALVRYRDSEAVKGEETFWNAIEARRRPFLDARRIRRYFRRRVLETRRMVDMEEVAWEFPEDETRALLTRVKGAYDARIEEILGAALAMALRAWIGFGEYVVDFEGHGREDIGESLDLSRTVGWFTAMYPVALAARPWWRARDVVRHTKARLRAVPRKGLGYGVLRYLGGAASAGSGRAEVSFNYLGQLGGQAGRSGTDELSVVWKDIGKSFGPALTASHALLVNSMVVDGKLRVGVLHHPEEIARQDVEELASYYRTALRLIIRHCGDETLTASDPDETTEASQVFGEAELAPIQRVFFENAPLRSLKRFNSTSVYFREERLDPALAKRALLKVVGHHDALRIVFRKRRGRYVQYNRKVGEGAAVDFRLFDATRDATKVHRLIGRLGRRRMNLKKGPLVRAAIIRAEAGDYLVLVVNHLVVDLVSMRYVMDDFQALYREATRGGETRLPDKTDSFIRWSNTLHHYFATAEGRRNVDYWTSVLRESATYVVKPDREVSRRSPRRARLLTASVDSALVHEVVASVRRTLPTSTHRAAVGVQEVLLALLGMALRQWQGRHKTLVLIDAHGREGGLLGLDVNRSAGFFLSLYPFVVDPGGLDSFSQIVLKIHRDLQGVFRKGLDFIGAMSDRDATAAAAMDGIIDFNYQGEVADVGDLRSKTEAFLGDGTIQATSMRRMTRLGISMRFVSGRFVVEIQYDAKEYDEATVESLLNHVVGAVHEAAAGAPAGDVREWVA